MTRPAALLRAAALTTVLAAGCGGDGGGGGDADPAASLAPSTPLYVEIVVKPEGDLRANAEAALRKVLRTDDPGRRLRELLDRSGLDYTKEIQPWIGERAGVALTGVRDGEPAFVVALSADDTDEARDAIARDGEQREHAGTTYRVDREEGFAAGVVGDAVLIAESEDGLRRAIDAAKADEHLDDVDAFRKARERHGDDTLAFAYADLRRALQLLIAAGGGDEEDAGLMATLLGGSGLRTASLALATTGDVVRLDGAVDVPRGAEPTGGGAAADSLTRLPAGSLAALGLGDIGSTVEAALTQLARIGGLPGASTDQVLAGLRAQFGIDIRRDLLSWMGETGVFLRGFDADGPDMALVVTSKDPARMRAALPKLERLMRRLGVATSSRAGGFAARLPDIGLELEVVARGDRFVVGAGSAVADALSPDRTLGDEPAFKAAAGALEGGTRPVLFVDVRKLTALLSGALGSDFAPVQPYLQAFGAAVAGGAIRDGAARGQLAVTLP